MDQSIRIPRHQTALMQLMQRLVSCGHVYWTTDRIPVGKLDGFISKWQPSFQLRADAAARAYRKRTGRASVHLLIHPGYLDVSAPAADWWMLSTAGKDGLEVAGKADGTASVSASRLEAGRAPVGTPIHAPVRVTNQAPGRVHDGRTLEGRLRIRDYELLEQPKTFLDVTGKKKTVTSWTWRMTPARYRQWEALLVDRALARDRAGIQLICDCLSKMPMFAGVRSQVIRLMEQTNKVLAKVKATPFEITKLPVMRMIHLWQEGMAV